MDNVGFPNAHSWESIELGQARPTLNLWEDMEPWWTFPSDPTILLTRDPACLLGRRLRVREWARVNTFALLRSGRPQRGAHFSDRRLRKGLDCASFKKGTQMVHAHMRSLSGRNVDRCHAPNAFRHGPLPTT